MKNTDSIKEFAKKYLNLYKSPETSGYYLEEYFGEDCIRLGFVMDLGKSFIRAYPNADVFYNPDNLRRIIDSIYDVNLLGSAVFSQWRSITHWDYCGNLLSPENREWFIIALTRLLQLAEQPNEIQRPYVKTDRDV